MTPILVDTSAWAAITDSADQYHEVALLVQEEIEGKYQLIVSNYILDETFTLLLMNVGYQRTLEFKQMLDVLIQAGILQVVWVTAEFAEEAWQVFEQFNTDKYWSFTDCVSYVVMKRDGILEAFTFDHHFKQMGFRCHP
jgi:predicted nucleic acid-binding protein